MTPAASTEQSEAGAADEPATPDEAAEVEEAAADEVYEPAPAEFPDVSPVEWMAEIVAAADPQPVPGSGTIARVESVGADDYTSVAYILPDGILLTQ